jgi:hypothetical protein
LERHAGPAYAVDGGDQRHLLSDHRRRPAGGRGARAARRALAAVNIFGGFLVTQRMLGMYKKKGAATKRPAKAKDADQ